MTPFVFFGTPDIAVSVLDELEEAGYLPVCVVTNPDTPQGRSLRLTPTPVAVWANTRNISILKPTTLRDTNFVDTLTATHAPLFIVAAYGKMIPQTVLDIPKHGVLNVHPSLLPKLRGASPIRSAILHNILPTGVTIMQMTLGMDEGPIIAQEVVDIPKESWPMHGSDLDQLLAKRGGALLAKTIEPWITGMCTPTPQNNTEATYCGKITKEMGLLNLLDDPFENLCKIRAFQGWPGTYYFHTTPQRHIRVKIIDAHISPTGTLEITRVIPEGKKETTYENFLASLKPASH